jgi:hypothetical protein
MRGEALAKRTTQAENWGQTVGGTYFLLAGTVGGFTVPVNKSRSRDNSGRGRTSDTSLSESTATTVWAGQLGHHACDFGSGTMEIPRAAGTWRQEFGAASVQCRTSKLSLRAGKTTQARRCECFATMNTPIGTVPLGPVGEGDLLAAWSSDVTDDSFPKRPLSGVVEAICCWHWTFSVSWNWRMLRVFQASC